MALPAVVQPHLIVVPHLVIVQLHLMVIQPHLVLINIYLLNMVLCSVSPSPHTQTATTEMTIESPLLLIHLDVLASAYIARTVIRNQNHVKRKNCANTKNTESVPCLLNGISPEPTLAGPLKLMNAQALIPATPKPSLCHEIHCNFLMIPKPSPQPRQSSS